MIQLKKIRRARAGDLRQVREIDARITGLRKPAYWAGILRRYRLFLVLTEGAKVQGYIVGEVRDWEFGSPPCGWVFAIDVLPDARLSGVGTRLLEAISALFRRAGVTKLRTLLASDNTLLLSFFRAQGMMAGSLIPLEMDLQ